MKERPILFSRPMVRAILEGRKTMTRRVVKLRYGADVVVTNGQVWKPARVDYAGYVDCPYGQVGDRLWSPWFREDCDYYGLLGHDGVGPVYVEDLEWKPSIRMPRTACHILLEITGVRVERLQDISEDDCLAEGIAQVVREKLPGIQQCGEYDIIDVDPVAEYRDLWQSINGPDSWAANPWVWVIEFKRVLP